eukprot:423436_1
MANCGALDIDLGPLGCISLHFSVLFDLGGGALSSTSTVVDVSGVGLCLFDLLNGALSSLFLFLDMNKWSLSLIIDVNWDSLEIEVNLINGPWSIASLRSWNENDTMHFVQAQRTNPQNIRRITDVCMDL